VEILILAALIGILPGAIANSKGHSFGVWWFFGAALFIVALPLSLVLRPNEAAQAARSGQHSCPHCAELVKTAARVCRHCGRDLVVV
jgi:hypothetical protein